MREPLSPHSLLHTISNPELVDSFTAGRLTIEENNCVLCHRPSDSLKISKSLETRPGPRLTDAGARLKAGWIFHWLENPQHLRPEAVMPRLFTADKQGMLERYAVAVYLASHGSLPDESKDPPAEATLNEGHRLFNQTGCARLPSAARKIARPGDIRELEQQDRDRRIGRVSRQSFGL